MKIYSPAYNSADDSMEYKLLNVDWCGFSDDPEEALLISYRRKTAVVHGQLSFQELDAFHPNLNKTLHYLCKKYESQLIALSTNVTVAVAYVLKSYVDLRATGLSTSSFPLMTQVSSVRSGSAPGLFSVNCLSFSLDKPVKNCIRIGNVNPADMQILSSDNIEKLWPGAASRIPVMESLGFTDDEILQHLYAGVTVTESKKVPESLQFEQAVKYPLDYLLDRTQLWHVAPDSCTCAVTHEDGIAEVITITRGELHEAKPHLPVVLDALIANQNPGRIASKMISVSSIKASINYDASAPVKYIEWELGTFPVDFIVGIDQSSSPDHVYLRFFTYAVNHLVPSCEDAAIPYIVDQRFVSLDVPYSWMNAHYPNWFERLNTGSSLGLVGEALASYVCTEHKQGAGVILDNMAFD